jgi:hypothetical protein
MSIVLVGSTSGSVTLQEPAVAGTTVLTLPAVSGTVITTGSPQSGSVLQVVQTSYSTEITNTSLTFADTGLSGSITPTSASSKILVIVSQAGVGKSGGTSTNLKLLRSSTDIITFSAVIAGSGNSNEVISGTQSCVYLDSPATTSSTTYKTQFAINNSPGTIAIVQKGSASTSTITLMEIAG